jgi:hypothetical protein
MGTLPQKIAPHRESWKDINASQGGSLNFRIALPVLAFGLFAALHLSSGEEPAPLALRTSIPLPNVKGRIDHFGVDVKGQRLFVAAVENHTLEVIDLKSGKAVHAIADLAEPQGVF